MAKYYVLTLTPEEHTELTTLVHQRRVASKRLVRAQCLLAVATNGLGWTDEQTSQAYGVSTRSLERLRQRAYEAGVDAALTGKPRQQIQRGSRGPPGGHGLLGTTGRPRPLDASVAGRAPGSPTGSAPSQTGDGGASAKKNALKPWKRQMWVIPPAQNAAFICAMERVLDVYQRPYNAARPVVCLDESPKQLLRESRQLVRLADGSTRYDCEYHRQGVAQLSMLAEPLAGRRRVQVEDRHDRLTFARVVARLLDEDYAQARCVTLVLDNLSAHQPAACYEVFAPARAHAQAWQVARNQRGAPTNWQFTTADARVKLKHLYPTIT